MSLTCPPWEHGVASCIKCPSSSSSRNGDLYAAIKKGDLNQAQINTYFQQMVSGVAYLHSMGVAHRDIKPENLLLDAHNVIKITDFGVSDVFRMCWEKTCHLSRGLCGSEPYIAPEQFEPKAQYDARLVDVWACAIVYYCMQVRFPAFDFRCRMGLLICADSLAFDYCSSKNFHGG